MLHPPPQAAIAAGTSGEAAPPNPQTDHETVTNLGPSSDPRVSLLQRTMIQFLTLM
ncbi:hypothetical protein Tco_0518393, partial [Tanacetum coccineum]